jgi:xylulokinase
MSRDLVVGIDSSTTGTKAIAWDRQGRLVAEGRAPVALANPRPAWFEQDPADWWSAAVAALGQLTRQVDAARIAGLAVSNQRETFGIFTEAGEPLRPGMVWLDGRSHPQMLRFAGSFGAERVHGISGKPLDTTPCLYRVLWLAEHEPDLLALADRVAEVHGFLCHRLTGRWATSIASADPTGMLDMVRLAWSEEILDAAGVPPAKMPALVPPGGAIGEVTSAAAVATGLRAGTPVFAGGGDGQCAGTGVGVLEPGLAYINLGTAVVSGTYARDYAHDPAFRTETAVADAGYVYETCQKAGTFLVDWVTRELYAIPSAERAQALASLEAEAACVPVGADGLLMVPYWEGCMTPHWDAAARGVIAGFSGSTRRGHIYRALLEGIALEQAEAATRAAAATGITIRDYAAIGGGAASALWAQILADATGCPVRRSAAIEASALGAAMAAARGAGWFGGFEEAAAAMAGPTIRRFDPDAARVRIYEELRAIHAELWPTLASWNRRLRAFAERMGQD